MKHLHLSALVLFVFLESVCIAAEPNALRNKIPHAITIQGYPCARGYAWFYPDGSLNQCTIASPAPFGDFEAPRGSVIQLWPNGTVHYLTFPHQTTVAGFRILGGMTAFYPDGKLRSINLVANQNIQGVPCRGSQWSALVLSTDSGNHVEFYQDGKLRSCKLTQDYGGQRSGFRLILPDQKKPAPFQ
jgi:hypothetical protein